MFNKGLLVTEDEILKMTHKAKFVMIYESVICLLSFFLTGL